MDNNAKSESPQSNKIPAGDSTSGHEASRSTTELRKLFARQKSSRQKLEDDLEQWVAPLFAEAANKGEPVTFDDSEKKLARLSKKKISLSRSTQLDLIKKAMCGDKQAWNILLVYFSATLRTMARKQTDRDHVDLYQEGAIGLIKALKILDASRSTNADAYLMLEAKRAMRLHIAKHYGMIRLPAKMRQDLRKLADAVKFLYARLGRAPSEQELAIKMEVSAQYIRRLRDVKALRTVKSLDSLSDDEDDEGSNNTFDVPDTSCQPDSFFDTDDLGEEIIKMLNGLSEKERLVLQLRFGLDGNHECSFKSIGARLKITKQRVWQIEAETLLKLKQTHLASQNDGYLPKLEPPPAASDSSLSTTISSWLCLIVLKRLRTCAGHELRLPLVQYIASEVINKIQMDDTPGLPSIVQEANELVYWTIQHLIADGLIREAFGGDELVMTEKGSSWLFYSK